MKLHISNFVNSNLFTWILAFLVIGTFSTCNQIDLEDTVETEDMLAVRGGNSPRNLPYTGNLVEVISQDFDYNMPEKIPYGWNTFRYHNDSPVEQFFVIINLPVFEGEQKTVEDAKAEVAVVFQDILDLLNEGKMQEAFAEAANLPAWYAEAGVIGGVGIVSPGKTAQTTINLEPGEYYIENYMKTNGTFHVVKGMITGFTVTDKASKGTIPNPTLNMTLSTEGGIEIDENIRPGLHQIEVYFKDQFYYANLERHDVHLIKLEEDTDLEELFFWMNWINIGGLETPAPVTFLGGTQEMAEGERAYLTVHLTPGTYAWISEVPNADQEGLFKVFTVPFGQETGRPSNPGR